MAATRDVFFFFLVQVRTLKKAWGNHPLFSSSTLRTLFFTTTKRAQRKQKQMTILPLSAPGRNTPSSQHSSYFPPSSSASNSNGPTIGLPGQEGFRRKADGGGYGFNGSSASARVHGHHHHQSSSMSSFVPLFLRRLFRFPHMDFQVQPTTIQKGARATQSKIRSKWKQHGILTSKLSSHFMDKLVCVMADGLPVYIPKDSVSACHTGKEQDILV